MNEQLQKVLARHDSLLSGRTTVLNGHATIADYVCGEEAQEEEEPEQLFRRCVRLTSKRLHLTRRSYERLVLAQSEWQQLSKWKCRLQ